MPSDLLGAPTPCYGRLVLYASWILGATVVLGLAIASCANDCRALAEDICFCEATESAQQACLERLANEASQNEASPAQDKACAKILASGSCTCDVLAGGDLAACGLTQPSP